MVQRILLRPNVQQYIFRTTSKVPRKEFIEPFTKQDFDRITTKSFRPRLKDDFKNVPIAKKYLKACTDANRGSLDKLEDFREEYSKYGFNKNVPFYLYPRFIYLICNDQNYIITQERLDDTLFYKDVSILFHLYGLVGNLQSFQCRLHDPDVLTPFDEARLRYKQRSYVKMMNIQSSSSYRLNKLLQFLDDCDKNEAEIFLRNVSPREKEKVIRRGSEFARLKFSILEKTYSNRFRIPLFLLPDTDFEDDFVSAIDLKRMENNFFAQKEILWKINPVEHPPFDDKIPFSSFCSHTINSVFETADFLHVEEEDH